MLLAAVICGAMTLPNTAAQNSISPQQTFANEISTSAKPMEWPSTPCKLDPCFDAYGVARGQKFIMICSAIGALVLALITHFLANPMKNPNDGEDRFLAREGGKGQGWLAVSRLAVAASILLVVLSQIWTGLPDYVSLANVDTILCKCAPRFDRFVRVLLRLGIGAMFNADFAAQVGGVLMALVPTLMRVIYLVLISPDDAARARFEPVLRHALLHVGWLTPMVTAMPLIGLCVMFAGDDRIVPSLVIAIWFLPTLLVIATHKATLRCLGRIPSPFALYLVFMLAYSGCMAGLVWRILLRNPGLVGTIMAHIFNTNFWLSLTSTVFVCNVAVSDLLFCILPDLPAPAARRAVGA
jgi:hypothetical protein